ncbi:MAG TPA: glycosyltransferase family 4 protein [Armatimonadota bacterium]
MNIAFLVVKHIARGGGIEKYTEELGSRLVQRGHAVRVYSMHHYGDVPRVYHGMRIIPVPCLPLPQLEKLSSSAFAIAHASLSRWADVVHLHHVGPGAFAWFAHLLRKPTLIQYHGLEWKRSRWGKLGSVVLKGLERWSFVVNRHFTAVSEEQCRYFKEQYGVDVRYIPCGTAVQSPTPPQEIHRLGLQPKRYILFASRLVREKGAQYLVPAFRRLDTDCKLVIAGDVPGADDYKQELVNLAGGDPRIIFPGYVEGRLRDELYSHALVYVQPSEIEGLSIALLEAMSYGLCCLVSDIPENLEAIAGHGVTFHNADVADLSRRLQQLLTTEGLPDIIAANATEHIRRQYSWDRITNEFEACYQTLVARHRLDMPAYEIPGAQPNLFEGHTRL